MQDKNYYKNLPRKRMASGALFFNENKEILIVKPNYKNYWLIPGGVIEENESPKEACFREVKEELGLNVKIEKLLCVNYNFPNLGKTETIQFIFWGGILTCQQIKRIKIQKEELDDFKFVKFDEAVKLVNKRLAKRIKKSLESFNNSNIYFESSC